MKKYLVVVEKTDTGFAAYSPDVDGCITTGKTREEVEANMKEALELHLEGLKEHGLPVPEPSAWSTELEVTA